MAQWVKFLSLKQSERNRALGLETDEEYRKRWISIRIIYFNGFLIYLAFGNITTSAWPYLKSLDPEATKTFLSYVFGIPSVMQLVFAPGFGYWNNKLSSIRMPMLLFLVIYVIGNTLYAVLEEIPDHRRHYMLVSRAFVGIAFVCCAIYRAYVSTATTVAERTKTMSYLALAQAIGLLAGSVFQSLFALLGEEGYRVAGLFQLNMYTANGWICVVLGVINIILMMPGIFEDQAIAVKEAMKGTGMATSKDVYKSLKLQYLATFLMVLAFGLLMFVYSAYQT
ncbi:major facilitator superfamily domain-containing protein 8-like [Uranotaenia lowii]|uniref:major facilitator superfamily domain-containing protein 8-like n=1 Tax=Uranotaenia lowii TaxID=190385 RepID=UPI00247AE2BF|nr:major facilitator superfamily domain-containing protein 8-like [Uranotaenia lowii]XP_055596938.1 major facilitator superfamily domain-containing protein 8-like [Uranotaenia lowii]